MRWYSSFRHDDLELFELEALRRGWAVFRDASVSVVKCPRCEGVIRFSARSQALAKFDCPCRRFDGMFPVEPSAVQEWPGGLLLARSKEKNQKKGNFSRTEVVRSP
jgi:hypothetical protein